MKEENKQRVSGVELLKVIGIFLIVICHIVSTLGSDKSGLIGYNDYFINVGLPSSNFQHVILGMLSYSGILGNAIFLISSFWYLLEKKHNNVQKIFRMLCEIWIISTVWLLVTILFTDIDLSRDYIRQSLLPSTYCNNWFLTYYMIFSFIFPFLNIIIQKIDKRKHLLVAMVLLVCYVIMPFIDRFPLATELILWVAIYFIVAYFKLYCKELCDNVKFNRVLLISNILIQLMLILGANFLTLSKLDVHIPLTKWLSNYNLFIYIIAFSALNVYRNKKFTSSIINYLASFSMLVYIIHENLLFRDFYRPVVWQWIYTNLGYDTVLLWAILYALVLFILSFVVAILYKLLLQKLIYKLVDALYSLIKKIGTFIFNKINNVLDREKTSNI